MAAPPRLNIVVFVSIALLLWYLHSGSSSSSSPRGAGRPGPEDVEMVVASMKKENVTWLDDFLLDWKKNIYVVDDPTAPLTVEVNKGREAMVFLTYIIDHYDRLPGTILFHHAERFQWHNDNPDYDALPLLQRLRLSHVENEGYVNLRCAWILGCPSEIKPHIDNVPSKQGEPITAKHVYKSAFEELFPGAEVPETIGVPCCSQFAVRREVVWNRKKEDYIRYRDWLLASPLGDDLSGRVLEYSWHIIFGKEPVHCPNAGECYCRAFGMCEMQCERDKCLGQYSLPPYSNLPVDGHTLGGTARRESSRALSRDTSLCTGF